MELVLLLLLVFLVLGSLVALEMRNLLSAVIAVGIVGLGLSIVFLLLGAPDIAITQVVVEVIIVTVMIRATSRTETEEPPGPRRDLPTVAVGLVALAAVLGFTLHAFAALPAFGAVRVLPSAFYLRTATELTGASNVVTAIILDYRGYDTLGEATVILTAVVAALAVLRRPSHRVAAAPPAADGPSLAPPTAVRPVPEEVARG